MTLSEYYAFKHALTPYIKKDEFTEKSDTGRYIVRSLYYDSHDLRAFHERDEGTFGRIKLRFRVYTDRYSDDETLSVELKTKKGLNMIKYSTLMPLYHYKHFLYHNDFNEDVLEPVVVEFLRLMHTRNLEPQLIVEYEREGYQVKYGNPLRLTFDHNVTSARAKSLFEEGLYLKPHQPNHVIFEIKCETKRPKWLLDLVKQYDLKIISNSKYVQGIEIIRPMMITPQDPYFYQRNKKNYQVLNIVEEAKNEK
jgi:hypothetical protein